jgi:hypothetical protein
MGHLRHHLFRPAVQAGVLTFRKGHMALFWLGIIFPLLWIIGAIMAPRQPA